MDICQTQGARCVSEAVRNVIHSLIGANGRGSRFKTKSDNTYRTKVNTTLVQVQGRLEELDDELKSLTTVVRQLLQASSFTEDPESTATGSDDVHDCGLTQLTEAIGHTPTGRQARKP